MKRILIACYKFVPSDRSGSSWDPVAKGLCTDLRRFWLSCNWKYCAWDVTVQTFFTWRLPREAVAGPGCVHGQVGQSLGWREVSLSMAFKSKSFLLPGAFRSLPAQAILWFCDSNLHKNMGFSHLPAFSHIILEVPRDVGGNSDSSVALQDTPGADGISPLATLGQGFTSTGNAIPLTAPCPAVRKCLW